MAEASFLSSRFTFGINNSADSACSTLMSSLTLLHSVAWHGFFLDLNFGVF